MESGNMNKPIIPILRIFDLAKAKEFYCGFLGWKIDWSHTFGDNFPVYMQISKDSNIIHLSEHYGDACPGSTIKINVENIEDMASKLKDKNYKYSKPSAEIMPWKTKEMWVHDPFGNKLMFYQDMAQ
jgi:extradiol dioxygenase family protein